LAHTLLITGAAGNLGGFLARHLLDSDLNLRLMVHRSPLGFQADEHENATLVRADLADPASLVGACQGADCIIHFAGKLFAPNPGRFLPVTNTGYAKNLIGAALDTGVKRFILVSFPHVEGPSSPEHPATDRLDGHPVSVHARTRLEEERYLFEACSAGGLEPVVLRAGMVYARGVLMVDAARKLMRRRLLGVWRRPTWIHLISLKDFLAAVEAAVRKPGIAGIFNLGDDEPLTLQSFLDRVASHWGFRRPWRAPGFLFYVAAWLVEVYATLSGSAAPLTRDFIRIGMVPYSMDTRRTRRELLPELHYPTLEQGLTEM
jgi:nucleoside-diphosphate-sugar epimerase